MREETFFSYSKIFYVSEMRFRYASRKKLSFTATVLWKHSRCWSTKIFITFKRNFNSRQPVFTNVSLMFFFQFCPFQNTCYALLLTNTNSCNKCFVREVGGSKESVLSLMDGIIKCVLLLSTWMISKQNLAPITSQGLVEKGLVIVGL